MKKIELDHFCEYAFPSRLRSNTRGDVSFVTIKASLAENRYDTTLWLWRDGALTRLTQPGKLAGHWWAGESLLLARPGGEKEQAWAEAGLPFTLLQTLPATGPGEAQEAARLFADVEDAAALPDGRVLLLARWSAAAEEALTAAGGDADKAAATLKEAADYEVLTELPFWENGTGYTSGCRRRLYLLQNGVASPLASPLTDTLTEVGSLSLSPCGGAAFFTAGRYAAKAAPTQRVMRLDTGTLEITDVSFAQLRCDALVALSADEVLVAGSDMHRHGLNQNPAFYRLNAATSEAATLYDGGAYSGWQSVGTDLAMADAPRWYAEGRHAFWIDTIGASSQLIRMDVDTGEIAPLTRRPGAVMELARVPGGHVVVAMRGLAGPELYRVDEDGNETQLTHFNDEVEKNHALIAPKPLSCTNAQGTEIDGWVLLPALPEGQSCPAILDIHGGPKAVYGPVVFHEMQYWAGQGFAVVYCNPTGGDGRGDKFSNIRGRYGSVDYDDVMGFLDAALAAHPCIDPRRLGVTGGSYGGFLTNWIIGHTTRFAAAASQRGISNWATMSTVSDISYLFGPDQTAADLWESPEKMWAQSPLKYAHRVKTPTLFIHSDEDYRCPLPEGLQMYGALADHGVETRLVLFRGENHELSRSGKPKHRVRRLQEITDWFRRFLLPDNDAVDT